MRHRQQCTRNSEITASIPCGHALVFLLKCADVRRPLLAVWGGGALFGGRSPAPLFRNMSIGPEVMRS